MRACVASIAQNVRTNRLDGQHYIRICTRADWAIAPKLCAATCHAEVVRVRKEHSPHPLSLDVLAVPDLGLLPLLVDQGLHRETH